MQLDAVIAEYHAMLDATNARDIFLHLDRELRARNMLVGPDRSRLICSVLRPRFIIPAQQTMVEASATLVGQAIRLVGDAVVRDAALRRLYALTPAEEALLDIDPGYPGAAMFGRLDGFLAADGSACWYVESNLESPAGIAYDEALADIFSAHPLMAQFRQRYHLAPLPVRPALRELLLDTYRAWGGSGTPTIAIVDYASAMTMSEFVHLRNEFLSDGVPALIVDPADLRYDGARLTDTSGTPIDLVYRRVLQHELLARYDLSHPLIRAYADGNVCVVNPFRTKPVHTKLIMALLSDANGPAAGILPPELQQAVERHIPWTRMVQRGTTRYNGEQTDLLSFAQQHRTQLVLKPNDDYGGNGVLLGWETPADLWERALEQAADAPLPWVVQERVPVPQELYPTWTEADGLQFTPRYVDSDPCVYGDTALGCLTRIAATSLLNVSAGGGAAPPTFVVRPHTG